MRKCSFRLLPLVAVLAVLFACTQPAPTPAATSPPTQPSAPKSEATKPATKPVTTPRPAATPLPRTEIPAGRPYYEGKTIEIVAATGAGGGTDTTARAVAAFLPKYIPGNPKIVVRNQAGAGGVIAANSFFEKAKPDGLTWLHGSSSLISNQQRGRDVVRYDLLKAPAIGNIGEAGGIIGISRQALPRLADLRAQPVVMGTRGGEETANLIPLYGREFLGWNVRWLTGFGGTGEIMLAFRRGEVDMFLEGGPVIRTLLEEELAEAIAQIGIYENGKFIRRSDFPQVPTFVEVLGDKRPTGLPWRGYMAGLAPQQVYKFTVSAPGTPETIMKILTDAYAKMYQDPRFNEFLRKAFSENYTVSIGKATEQLMKEALDISPEVAGYADSLLRKFGVIK